MSRSFSGWGNLRTAPARRSSIPTWHCRCGPELLTLGSGAVSIHNRRMAQLENFRLKVFRTVAEHLSFHKAAEHLFLTQPAVTQQVKALEDELGVRLFDRTPKGVLLTEQGSLLLQYAQKAAALTAEAAEKLASGDGKLSGEFALGVSTTIAQYVLPRLIGAFLSEHSRVQLSLQSGNTAEIVRSCWRIRSRSV